MDVLTAKTFFFGEFKLDGGKRLLVKNGQAVSLNPKAFEMLLALIENHGRVLSKDELLEKVWAGQFVEENNLTVHISALRKIFGEKKGANQFILTIPGRGYSFVHEVRREAENSLVKTDTSNAAIREQNSNDLNEREAIIGRAAEITEIKRLLRRPNKCLITLTGAGGSGKTTLARTIAAEMQAEFSGGVFFVELAAINRPELVAAAIAQVLDVKESGSKSALDALKEFLRERSIFLVLDNFEQLLSAASLLQELCDCAANLKILVTSRAALRLKIEQEKIVLPLAVPPPGSNLSAEELNHFAAVELFAARAREAKPAFALNEENASVIAEICGKLDGLPLAIELAAVRVKLLAPQAILARLEHSLQLLTGGARDLPARQRTMRGAIEWSYELLDQEEKFLFRRLAIFSGGFTVEAAEFVADQQKRRNGENQLGGDLQSVSTSAHLSISVSVLDLISSLVDNNLLVLKEQTDGSARLQMLEVVRDFAFEILEETGELDDLQHIHTQFYLSLAEEAEPFLEGEAANEWLEKLEIEHDNIRAALRWSLKNDAPTAARIAAAVRAFWIDHSHHGEGFRWCEAALQETENSLFEARLKLLATCGNFLRVRGELEAARKYHERGLAESLKLNNRLLISRNNYGLGVIALLQKDYAAAQNFYQKALAVNRETNEELGIAYSLNSLGDLEMCQGNFSAARALFEECLTRTKKIGSERLLLTVYFNLGMVEFFENSYEAAARIFAETLRIAREMGNKTYVAYSLDGFAALAAEAGNREQSARLSGAAASLRTEIGYKIEPAEEIFREKYLAQIHRALDEKHFAALYAQGKAMNSDEAAALARLHPAQSGAIGNQPNQAFQGSDKQSEIIVENHKFSRIVIEEEFYDD